MRTKNMIVTTLALGLLAGACAGGPASGSGANVVDDDPAEAEETDAPDEDDRAGEPEEADESDDAAEGASEPAEEDAADDAEDAALGTRDNPLEIGTRIEMGDWSLSVTEVDLDATEAVLEENQFNDPPTEGRQFVLFTVEATYKGEESGTAWIDFSWAIVGSAGNTFSTGSDDRCGVIPDGLSDTGETFPDGSVSGNVCFSVDADQIEGGTIRIEEAFSFDDTRAFYALD